MSLETEISELRPELEVLGNPVETISEPPDLKNGFDSQISPRPMGEINLEAEFETREISLRPRWMEINV